MAVLCTISCELKHDTLCHIMIYFFSLYCSLANERAGDAHDNISNYINILEQNKKKRKRKRLPSDDEETAIKWSVINSKPSNDW